MSGLPDKVVIEPDIQQKREPYGAKKIRKVCAKCNSGWMSRIESAAKPILTELILGNTTTLESTHQKTLSIWTVMTSIVAEYTHRPTLSIPSHHRDHLMKTNTPPEGWHIWIGTYSGVECNQHYRHHGMCAASRNEIPPDLTECNTQFSSFWIGSLFIHAASSTVPNFNVAFNTDRLIQIWPSMTPYTTLPTSMVLSDEDANYIADALPHKMLGNGRFHRKDSYALY